MGWVGIRVRWCRSAQPPANCLDPLAGRGKTRRGVEGVDGVAILRGILLVSGGDRHDGLAGWARPLEAEDDEFFLDAVPGRHDVSLRDTSFFPGLSDEAPLGQSRICCALVTDAF